MYQSRGKKQYVIIIVVILGCVLISNRFLQEENVLTLGVNDLNAKVLGLMEGIVPQQKQTNKNSGNYSKMLDPLHKKNDPKRRVLADLLLLPQIPLDNTDLRFDLYSVVPVRSQETFTGATLAIIGSTAWDNNIPVTVDDNYGMHFIRYNDDSVDQVFKVRKHTNSTLKNIFNKNPRVVIETIWYAEMPDEVAKEMFNPDSTQACTTVTVLLGSSEMTANAVAELNVCHNPSILPQPDAKVDITYCLNSPPFFKSKNDNKEGKLSGGMADVVPNILYHLHSGVDLFVIYIPFSIREVYLKLLEPIIERYGNQLLFVDLSSKWNGKEFPTYSISQEVNKYVQNPLSQDCLNRLKGHSHFFRTIDFDEFDMIFSQMNSIYTPQPLTFAESNFPPEKKTKSARNDKNYKMPYISYAISMLRTEESPMDSEILFHTPKHKNDHAFDCLSIKPIWFRPEGKENDKILPHTNTYIPFRTSDYGKCLCRPEKIAVTWLHYPANCFEGDCVVHNWQGFYTIGSPLHFIVPEDNNNKTKDIKQIELGYAHIRRNREWSHNSAFMAKYKAEGHLIHTSLFNEVVKKLEDELVELYGTTVPADFLKSMKLN